MANGRVEVITSVERRRRWSSAQKQELVAATLEPGASVSAIAREGGVHPSQLYGWRRQLRAALPVGFAPVRIASGPAPDGAAGAGAIEIEFAGGARMRISGAADVTDTSVIPDVIQGRQHTREQNAEAVVSGVCRLRTGLDGVACRAHVSRLGGFRDVGLLKHPVDYPIYALTELAAVKFGRSPSVLGEIGRDLAIRLDQRIAKARRDARE